MGNHIVPSILLRLETNAWKLTAFPVKEMKCAQTMANRTPPDPIYVLRGSEAAINVVKFAPKSARSDGLLLSG